MTEQSYKAKKPIERGFYEPYAAFSRTLRTWLVAYGIGAPVLFASQDAFEPILKEPNKAALIIGLFLFGAMAQIIAAVIYKYVMGYIYFGELDEAFQKTRRHKVSEWISESMWLEMFFDLVSIGCFVWATLRILVLYVKMGQINSQ